MTQMNNQLVLVGGKTFRQDIDEAGAVTLVELEKGEKPAIPLKP